MDVKSVMSASSLGSSSSEARNSFQLAQEQPKNRRFVASLGKIGQAKEAREVVSKLINMRIPPISNALDYESFITEFNGEMESDPLRELLIFPRDDLALLKPCDEELSCIEKASAYFAAPTHWQLTRDSLQFFSLPCSLIKFNYERFFGDCEKYIASSGLDELVFEQLENVDSGKDKDSLSPVGVLKEGYLQVDSHADNFVRNLKGRKRRYCVIRRNAQTQITMELLKQQDALTSKTLFIIKSAYLKTSNKQRTTILELISDAGEECNLFPSESEPDIKPWFNIIDHALKNSTVSESENQDEKTPEPSLNEQINESFSIADSYTELPVKKHSISLFCCIHSAPAPKRKNCTIAIDDYEKNFNNIYSYHRASRKASTVESLLKPPLVKRKNVFCLYNNVEPICRPSGEMSALLEDQDNYLYKICNPENKPPSSSNFDLRHCHTISEELTKITVKSNSFKIHVKWEETSEQIEPFFLHIFLFDLQNGQRVSEELSFTIATNEYAQHIQNNSSNNPNKMCIFGVNNFNLQAQFTLPTLNPNIYIVCRVERLLSCPSDIYMKSHLDKKQLIKNAKMVNSALQRLSSFRTIFAWTARPIQQSTNDIEKPDLPFFRVDGRLSDLELKKYLTDFNKLQKSGKIQLIPNASMNLIVDVKVENVDLPLKQLNPLVATNLYSTSPIIHAEHLPSAADTVKPLRTCTNFLYIYPQQLAYGSQKNFSRARNIVCSVSLVRLKDGQTVVEKCFLDLANLSGPRVESINCSLQYHDQNPTFSDEIKLELPLDLNEGDHLLFKFLHISLANAQKAQSAEGIEQNVGYAWIPLVNDNGLFLSQDIQEFELPIAVSLTPDYFNYDPTDGHSKKSESTSLKWVDSAKPLFKVKFRLHSALVSSTLKLHQFFQNCSDTVDDTEWLLESAADNPFEGVEFGKILPHLHVLLNRLLQMFTRTGTIGLSSHVLKILVQLSDLCFENGKKQELREFVRFHCAVGGEFDANARLLYEGILESIGLLLSNNKIESTTTIKTLKHLWLILDICIKSMSQTIVLNGSHKISRRKRFSAFTSDAMQQMFSEVSQQILKHHRRYAAECRSANVALAYFAKYCLNIADRGVIFNIIYDLIKAYDLSDSGFQRRYKIEFLQMLSGHEHWIPLNVPIVFDSNGKPIFNVQLTEQSIGSDEFAVFHYLEFRVAKSSLKPTGIISRIFSQFMPLTSTESSTKKSLVNVENFQLSKPYCQLHFLLGLLIQEFSMALHESRAYRRLVVTLLRNLLVKHSSDVRYENMPAQSRIAVLYSPLICVILENISEFELVRRFEPKEIQQALDDQRKFDYPQASARSIISKDQTLSTSRQNDQNGTQRIAQFAEKLDMDEAKDLILCCLYLLKNLPKPAIIALSFNFPENFVPSDQADNFPIIQLLKLAVRLFRCREKGNNKAMPVPSKKTSLTVRDVKSANTLKGAKKIQVQETHLAQEVALICLDVSQALAEHVAGRWNASDINSNMERHIFNGLVRLKLDLVGEDWPEGVRLHSLNSLGMFIELFSTQLASNYGADALSRLSQRLLFFLNSRLERVQAASAALLHLLIRQGFNNTIDQYTKQNSNGLSRDIETAHAVTAEWLGNPGVQIISSIANLLGQNELSADCSNFEKGLRLFESLTVGSTDRKLELFRQAAQDLTDQIRDIFKATISISAARNDPIRLAELHVQLANNYRGSPALRIAWLDTCAQLHVSDRCYSEAVVCQAHCCAIIAKQLSLRDGLKIDFSLFDTINKQISIDENLNGPELAAAQSSKFTTEALTSKVEETMKTLIQGERYEACGPLCRLAIPIYEQQANHKALISIYAELNQAYSRAFEIQTSGKRHLATYFRIILYSPTHFKEENEVEYIYREPGLTSLAEASDRMVQIFRKALNTDQVRFLTELDIDPKTLDQTIANIGLTYVEPLNVNPTHTNIQDFFYEKPIILPQAQNEKVSDQARLSLKRVFLQTEESFPNTRRRLKVVKRTETTLNPLELACENLHKKSNQIQKMLKVAGIPERGPLALERCKINAIDVKGLQLLLQGAISPSVNVGSLSYAEAFTTESQRLKYGPDGIENLKIAFRVFMSQLARALYINGLAVGPDQADYQTMLNNSFDGMIERLSSFFDGENFLPEQLISPTSTPKNSTLSDQTDSTINARNSLYILDSIRGR